LSIYAAYDIIQDEIRVGIYKAEGFENATNSTAEQETLNRWIEIVKLSNSTVLEAPNIAAAKWTKNIWLVALPVQAACFPHVATQGTHLLEWFAPYFD
jgi:hypothetical protein